MLPGPSTTSCAGALSFGGRDTWGGPALDKTDVYDPDAITWATFASMPTARLSP